MKKTRQEKAGNFEHFMETLSRVFGIPRRRLDRIMYVRVGPIRPKKGPAPRRKSNRPFGVVAK